MLPSPFQFERPSTIADAVRAVGDSGDGMFYAGGTELLLAMKMRVIRADRLIDIKGIPGLDCIAVNDMNEIEIGARCTHKKIAGDSVIREHVPALSSLCAEVANIRVRNVGTIGGNLCFGEPHADPPTMLAALNARLVLEGSKGAREIHADDFIRSEMETVREPDELLRVIVFPRPAGPVTYRRFKHGERPSVNVAMAWSLNAGGSTIRSARVRVGALGSRPQPLTAVEDALRNVAVAEARRAIETALPAALDQLEVNADRHGGADYKRHLAGVLLLRNAAEAIIAGGSWLK
ncbi:MULTISPECIES: FAD binding domain-containing protein [Bradyrhizobium]|jgi:aerobic carbon-monoxide dehydrogenase medium subunit|uniref:FAD binding domain-containing protein n=1 Tax=Bradyrhizobium TaxID=374 RepID=UPI000486E46E|nr:MULTISPECIES: FAD binding domain-containing protein [Bradyrhizobium]MCS3447243.1 carbon-monoxide dehydrogenase medium subunit [Bradyrhizobium elkanii]MCS3561620.1 carbon-monoxide dehydrogenase medium subunit [Bradyrhizobium elkanii]MCW2148539.1 carbon-monoxide dehydrogenase medium subunit [Bradyrhizobium elkanii]MCW2352374.1 carbon-monoxide dehydrogenase medium subunit [Bradyrhizobium elkanii]MCW2372267.1 carbon-monoxide dehydrogenase medium subunit [Bradyrhizobium elkanii]